MAICHALLRVNDVTAAYRSPKPLVLVRIQIDATQIQEIRMLRFLMCLFGFHGATEIDYTIDDEEIMVCRVCLKEVK